jgi:hypothetical protein
MSTFYGNVSKVVAGEASQADVQKVFGLPRTVLAEETLWMYSWQYRNRVSDPLSGFLIESQQVLLTIRFDERGIVRNVHVMVSEITPKAEVDPFNEVLNPDGPIAEPYAPNG